MIGRPTRCQAQAHVKKKIPAGCPAGEGGMVEEIYIHYYRHLVQEKVTPFWKKNARNCSGGLLDLPPPQNRTYGLNLKVLSGSCSRWISWQFLQLFWSSPAGAFAASRLFSFAAFMISPARCTFALAKSTAS